jgi:hypothetical protein
MSEFRSKDTQSDAPGRLLDVVSAAPFFRFLLPLRRIPGMTGK